MSLLVISEILGLILNTVTADGKYCLVMVRIYRNKLKCNYLRNKTLFGNVLLHF